MRMELEILYEMREREEEDGESCSVELKYELQDNVGLSKNTMFTPKPIGGWSTMSAKELLLPPNRFLGWVGLYGKSFVCLN